MQLKRKRRPNANYFDLNAMTKTVDVTYQAGKKLDKMVTVTAKYVDICNVANAKGTVVTLSGSPGSHNDYKYMAKHFEKKNVRFVGTNWPGSEFVTGGLRDSFTNPERNSYVLALMEKLELEKVNKLIVMGHSRSGESAFQMASLLSEDKKWPLVGCVAINSPGFVPHKGLTVRMGLINFIAFLIQLHCTLLNYILFPVLDWFYNDFIGLYVADGKVAAAAILPMKTFAFGQQKETIDDLKTKPWLRVFFGYGAKDFLINECESEEIAMYFTGNDHYIIPDKFNDKKQSPEIIAKAKKSFMDGKSYVTANFTEEGHYLQKNFPEFILEMIEAMFEAEDLRPKD